MLGPILVVQYCVFPPRLGQYSTHGASEGGPHIGAKLTLLVGDFNRRNRTPRPRSPKLPLAPFTTNEHKELVARRAGDFGRRRRNRLRLGHDSRRCRRSEFPAEGTQVVGGERDVRGFEDPGADTASLMTAIVDVLPPAARRHRTPTPEQLHRSYPPGQLS